MKPTDIRIAFGKERVTLKDENDIALTASGVKIWLKKKPGNSGYQAMADADIAQVKLRPVIENARWVA